MKFIFIIVLSLSFASSFNFIKYSLEMRLLMDTKKIVNISDFKWKSRPLIIPNPSIVLLNKIADNEASFIERDIVIIIMKNDIAYIDSQKISQSFSNSILAKDITIENNNITLIGLDGLIKKSYSKNIKLNQIFMDIDSMPMRMYELKNK
jgi:hypothetical protein|tara:strand:+ start:1059 stop:1508 length:450 start_codon:yes stop_codon:yes gene_type:complete